MDLISAAFRRIRRHTVTSPTGGTGGQEGGAIRVALKTDGDLETVLCPIKALTSLRLRPRDALAALGRCNWFEELQDLVYCLSCTSSSANNVASVTLRKVKQQWVE